jgi:hypothetical protein
MKQRGEAFGNYIGLVASWDNDSNSRRILREVDRFQSLICPPKPAVK